MARMHPKSNKRFKSGNRTKTGQRAPVMNFAAMAKNKSILLIVTVDNLGKVTSWNHPKTPRADRLQDITHKFPYLTSGIYDVTNVTLATYSAPEDPKIVELGIWNPGPPRRMYS
jgi:hypothetical protein